VKITFVFYLYRIGKLVFVKIGKQRHILNPCRSQSPKSSDINKGGTYNTVKSLRQFVQFPGIIRGGKPHAPLPFAGWKCHEFELEGESAQTGKKGFVRAPVIWFKDKYLKVSVFGRIRHQEL
jgi:hypothetical protein